MIVRLDFGGEARRARVLRLAAAPRPDVQIVTVSVHQDAQLWFPLLF